MFFFLLAWWYWFHWITRHLFYELFFSQNFYFFLSQTFHFARFLLIYFKLCWSLLNWFDFSFILSFFFSPTETLMINFSFDGLIFDCSEILQKFFSPYWKKLRGLLKNTMMHETSGKLFFSLHKYQYFLNFFLLRLSNFHFNFSFDI